MRFPSKKMIKLALVIISIILLNTGYLLANEPSNFQTKLSETEISRQLQSLPEWKVEDGQLRRTYVFENFVQAIAFVNLLIEPAEKAGHHPDLSISYNRVTVSLTTHDAGGITQKDFDLAQVVSRLFLQTQSN
jgi:4a-hydroxytetrahydrobiopterin dehydratase